jgi:phage-related protein
VVAKMKKVTARFYRTKAGGEPVRDWLLGLSRSDRKHIGADIATVEYGWPIGMATCRPLKGGIYEVRTDLAEGRTARVLFGFHEGGMVLLHGFIKKTQKTPPEDLAFARKLLKEVTK